MNIIFENVGEGRGRASKFVVQDDGTKVHYSIWKQANKQKRGRKAFARDTEGNVIRPEKVAIDLAQIAPPPKFVQPIDMLAPTITSETSPASPVVQAPVIENTFPRAIIPEIEDSEEAIQKVLDEVERDMESDEEFSAKMQEIDNILQVKKDEFSRL